MKINKKPKKGFTLAELMVFFVFISIILAASMPLITKRARNIPAKMNHGKYICTQNDDGTYNEVYYNSFKRVDVHENLGACSFTPPKKASLFKIELIGGGAGGFQYDGEYAKVRDIPNEDSFEGEFRLYPSYGASYGSEGYKEPPMSILRTLFTNAEFTIVNSVKSAGNGNDVYPDLQYTGLTDPHLNNIGSCYKWIHQERECTAEDKDEDKIDGKCYEKVKDDDSAQFECIQQESDLARIREDIVNYAICSYEYGDCRRTNNLLLPDWKGNNAHVRTNIVGDMDESGNLLEPTKYGVTLTHFGTGTKMRPGWGCSGGSGSTIYVNGKIKWMDYSRGVMVSGDEANEKYLKNLFTSYYVTGNTDKPGVCSDFRTGSHSVYNEHDGKYNPDDNENDIVKENKPSLDKMENKWTSFVMQGRTGRDVVRYDAIRVWNNCVTNSVRATGGKGGHFEYDSVKGELRSSGQTSVSGSDYFKYSSDIGNYCEKVGNAASEATVGFSRNAGGTKPAPGKVLIGATGYGSDNYARSKYPFVKSNTKLNVREHTVGEGGGAATPKVFYTTNLGSDCIIKPGKAGDVAKIGVSQNDITDLEKDLVTSMTCNEGTYSISVKGGSYSTSQKYSQRHHTIYNLKANGEAINTKPSEFKTPVPSELWNAYYAKWGDNGGPNAPYVSHTGEKSLFIPNGVFTKFILGAAQEFGAGGNGSSVVDRCVEPRGTGAFQLWYTIGGVDQSSGEGEKNKPITSPNTCDSDTMVERNPATKGKQGAVIITW